MLGRGKSRPISRVAGVADVMGRDFMGSSYSVRPDQLARIRQEVASSASVVMLLSNALVCEPTALVAIVAAYDLGKSIVGVVRATRLESGGSLSAARFPPSVGSRQSSP